jgi:hypothetical protein
MITKKELLSKYVKERIRKKSEWGGRIEVLVEVTDRRTQTLCWRSLNAATWQHFFVFYPAVLSDQALQCKYWFPDQHNTLLLLLHVNIIIIKISDLQYYIFQPEYVTFSCILWIKDIFVLVFIVHILKRVLRMIIYCHNYYIYM